MAAEKFIAPIPVYGVLDANALLPPRLSDVLFDIQAAGIYKARWSAEIELEFLRNWGTVAVKNPHPDPQKVNLDAERRLNCFRNATHEYEIMGHLRPENIAKVPSGVQQNDKHVAAAALQLRAVLDEEGQSGEVCLVSNNLKHLAVEPMKVLGVVVLTPGAFIDKFATHTRIADAVRKAASDLRNPPYTLEQLLAALLVHGAEVTVNELCKSWGVTLPKTLAGKASTKS